MKGERPKKEANPEGTCAPAFRVCTMAPGILAVLRDLDRVGGHCLHLSNATPIQETL